MFLWGAEYARGRTWKEKVLQEFPADLRELLFTRHREWENTMKTTENEAPYLIDSHCHLSREEYGADLEAVMERAVHCGLRRLLVVGTDIPSSRSACQVAVAHRAAGAFAAVGVHPHSASSIACLSHEARLPDELLALADAPRVVAIGETGLDYHYDYSPREQQRSSFREHIRWAHRTGKPLVIHGRESYTDLLQILRDEGGEAISAVVHCFSGTESDAEAFLAMGYSLSFAGPLTFIKNDALRRLFRALPSDRILLETDAPYLAPHPLRGRRNEPSFIGAIYDVAAEVRATTTEALARQLRENAARLFHWPLDDADEPTHVHD